jgi:hypothetical protein
MGSWAVTIHGHGVHDNGKDDDAEHLVSEFIENLKARGQVVHAVRFTVGTDRELTKNGEWRYAS